MCTYKLYKYSLFILFFLIIYSASSTYVKPKLPKGTTTVLSTVENAIGIHTFAIGQDPKVIFHKYLLKNATEWTEWIPRMIGPNSTIWDSDPVAGVSKDGSIHLFCRNGVQLDVFAMFNTDPKNPDAWNNPLESGKLQDLKWVMQPLFPTSDMVIYNSNDLIRIYFRGFDGALYMVQQEGINAQFYTPPFRYDTIME